MKWVLHGISQERKVKTKAEATSLFDCSEKGRTRMISARTSGLALDPVKQICCVGIQWASNHLPEHFTVVSLQLHLGDQGDPAKKTPSLQLVCFPAPR